MEHRHTSPSLLSSLFQFHRGVIEAVSIHRKADWDQMAPIFMRNLCRRTALMWRYAHWRTLVKMHDYVFFQTLTVQKIADTFGRFCFSLETEAPTCFVKGIILIVKPFFIFSQQLVSASFFDLLLASAIKRMSEWIFNSIANFTFGVYSKSVHAILLNSNQCEVSFHCSIYYVMSHV